MTQTTMERAFQLAASGKCHGVADIKSALKNEGYDSGQIVGQSLFKQLKDIMGKAVLQS